MASASRPSPVAPSHVKDQRAHACRHNADLTDSQLPALHELVRLEHDLRRCALPNSFDPPNCCEILPVLKLLLYFATHDDFQVVTHG